MGNSYKLSAGELKQKCLSSLREGDVEGLDKYRALMVPNRYINSYLLKAFPVKTSV